MTNSTMPRLSQIETKRTLKHLSSWKKKRSILLSSDHSDMSIISDTSTISNNSDHSNNSSNSSSLSSSAGWIICDDYRTDRFSEQYYRHYWGLHKGGLVLGTFLGMILIVSALVGAAFIR